ncbi:MAG: molecular chaperone DnaJ [Acidimicrobiales bacterium]|nr:MAG: molecular chaperone DnaJ [Acidimicrobiales bacterium]
MAPQREWFEKDYYKVLGVPKEATDKDLTRAYRKLAKRYHPDANPGSEERFKEISAAYDVLGDPAKRKEYDEVRALGPISNPFGGPTHAGAGAGRPGPGGNFNFHIDDLSDLLGGIFGQRTRPGPGVGQRGDDLEAELHLGFLEAVEGVTTTVNLIRDVPCHTCGGTGAAPGSVPMVCSRCGGRGLLDDNLGRFSLSQTCPACGGRGLRVETPCPTCHGRGVESRPRAVKVRIPTGVEDGQRIRIKGRGGPGHDNGPSGDLYVVVRVAPHPLFGRRGSDLTLAVPVSFPEATLGATISVPTLANPVRLRMPPGTRNGQTFRVRGRGVPRPGAAGDLLVTVGVAVPEKLSDEERTAVEALASASTGSPRSHLGV